jgi:hypothetical protein
MVNRTIATDLDLSGTPAELRAVGDVLCSMTAGSNRRFGADPTADPTPYGRVLDELEIVATDGPVQVWVAGDKLLAAGSPDALKVFSSFFEFPDGVAVASIGVDDEAGDPGRPSSMCDVTPECRCGNASA